MSLPDRALRAFSFGEIADDYDKYRPGPSIEAARWILGEGRRSVLDLGAGTGGLTRSLVQFTPRVIAVEPDPRMRSVLTGRSDGAGVMGAVGERLPVVTASMDGVVASSSWHWMDPALAGAEVARVLRPGGVFGLLWSGPDRRVSWVNDVIRRRRRTLADHGDHRQRRTMVLTHELPFSTPETTVIRFSLTMDLDDLAGLSGTYSVVILGGGSERDARIAAVRERARLHPEIGDGPVELPMVCRCWRAYRTEGPSTAS
ncbi:MAG: class I SAM-dependent methyltransferase [Acidimicrobiales bacterium]